MYTAIVLTSESQSKLIAAFADILPPTWRKICHHCTIDLKPIESSILAGTEFKLGDQIELTAVKLAHDEFVAAVQVVTNVPSMNAIKHITLGVNVEGGGKPMMSNKLTNWQPISPIVLSGTISQEN